MIPDETEQLWAEMRREVVRRRAAHNAKVRAFDEFEDRMRGHFDPETFVAWLVLKRGRFSLWLAERRLRKAEKIAAMEPPLG